MDIVLRSLSHAVNKATNALAGSTMVEQEVQKVTISVKNRENKWPVRNSATTAISSREQGVFSIFEQDIESISILEDADAKETVGKAASDSKRGKAKKKYNYFWISDTICVAKTDACGKFYVLCGDRSDQGDKMTFRIYQPLKVRLFIFFRS